MALKAPSRSWMGVEPDALRPAAHPYPTCASEQARKLRYPSPIKGEGKDQNTAFAVSSFIIACRTSGTGGPP